MSTGAGCGAKELRGFSTMDCLSQLTALYDAYTSLLTGRQRVRIQYGNYWVEYRPQAPQDVDKLLALYNTLYSQCPLAAANGLPDLDTGRRVRRGPAIRGRY